ncbi:hypothetical protein [Streptomyces sp. B6B3]|uniref:hypothetical protein n=1 Tax=Streptomyces sp. B6B3 TaxID=3153570 RepID=UPI00325E1DF2
MRTLHKVGAFGACLALTLGAAYGVGNAVGPVDAEPEAAPHDSHAAQDDGAAGDGGGGGHGGHGGGGGGGAESSGAAPAGLQVTERGYTLHPMLTETPVAGEETDFAFHILGPDGQPVTGYQENHEKDLHLIVVRRDQSGYQHVHPTLGADGLWTVPLTFASGGDHRVFADFTPAGDPEGQLTLGVDVAVEGPYQPAPQPEHAATATVDGYTVTLDGELTAGGDSELTLSVSRDGRPVTDLQPYLGAYGHLVVLRAGDLAYLHVHPEGEPGDGETPSGPGITFHTEAPSDGSYRLYLDFRHDGAVHTAEFTVTAGHDH